MSERDIIMAKVELLRLEKKSFVFLKMRARLSACVEISMQLAALVLLATTTIDVLLKPSSAETSMLAFFGIAAAFLAGKASGWFFSHQRQLNDCRECKKTEIATEQ